MPYNGDNWPGPATPDAGHARAPSARKCGRFRGDGAHHLHDSFQRAVRSQRAETMTLQNTLSGAPREAFERFPMPRNTQMFRVLTETLPQLIWTCTPTGSCDFLSGQWLACTGVPEAQQLGYGWLDLVHGEDRDRMMRAWTRTLNEQAPYDVEYWIRSAESEYRWFQARAHPLRRENATVDRWLGTCSDIPW